MRIYKILKENKYSAIQLSVIIIILPLLLIHICFKINAPISFLEATWSSGDLLSYFGSIISAIATIIALVLTIEFTVNNQKTERKLSIRPIITTDHRPLFIGKDSFHEDDKTTYVRYPFTTIGTMCSSYSPMYPLLNDELMNNKSEFYILKYQIKNAGAGNAIDLMFLIDNQKFMKPITLAANEERDVILILGSGLIENSRKKLEMCFRYQDVASIAMYEQKEYFNFYNDPTGGLNISQFIEDSISQPIEIKKRDD